MDRKCEEVDVYQYRKQEKINVNNSRYDIQLRE